MTDAVSRTVTAVWKPKPNVEIYGHATLSVVDEPDVNGNVAYRLDFTMEPINGEPQICIEGKFPALGPGTDEALYAFLMGEVWNG